MYNFLHKILSINNCALVVLALSLVKLVNNSCELIHNVKEDVVAPCKTILSDSNKTKAFISNACHVMLVPPTSNCKVNGNRKNLNNRNRHVKKAHKISKANKAESQNLKMRNTKRPKSKI